MMTAITNPTESPIPPMTAIKLIVVRRTASFTALDVLRDADRPDQTGIQDGSGGEQRVASLGVAVADDGVGCGLAGVQRLLHLGPEWRVVVLAHGRAVRVGQHDPGGIGGDDATLHLGGGSADQSVERRSRLQ